MKRFFLYIGISLLFVPALLADETCDQSIDEAKQKYNAGNYEKAKALFEFVASECGSNYGDVNSWIAKCNSVINPTLSLSRTSVSLEASSNSTSITVNSNSPWRIQNSNTWFSVWGSGSSINVSCSSNTSTSSRTGYFDVVTTNGKKSLRVSVTQSGKAVPTLSLSKTSISASKSGTTEYITVTSNTTWEIQYSSGSMYSVTRSGSTLIVKIEPNTSNDTRSDYFNVKTTDGNKIVKVEMSQSGASTLSVSRTTLSCSSGSNTEYLTVTSNSSWEVQYASGAWYSVTRSGNSLTVNINENTSNSSRSDYFNVKTTDGSKVVKVTMNQSGKTSSSSYAIISNAYAEHNVYVSGEKGMKIHVKFDAYNVLNHVVKPCAYFYFPNGTALLGIYGSGYITTDGKVTVQQKATANYVNTLWNDFVLFMPYNKLNMPSGCKDVSLKCEVGIYDETLNKWLTSSYSIINFTFSN